MKLLLDTHALVWWLTDNPRLSNTAREAIADPTNIVLASPASGYEIADQERQGRLAGGVAQDLGPALRATQIRVLPLSLEHAAVAGALPGPHRDPWDRLIMAQARVDRLTIVSSEAVFQDYGLPVCW